MAGVSFIQKSELFSYSGTNCIRNDYFHNTCQLCVDICPQGAFEIIRNRLTLVANLCIECAGCIGSCPTEALTIANFDPNAFVKAYETLEEREISCKKNTPCLGTFDRYHYIAMALNAQKEPLCDLSHCAECPLNESKKIESFIRAEIDESNHFLLACGALKQIAIKEQEESPNPKRALFRTALTRVKELGDEKQEIAVGVTKEYQQSSQFNGVPLKFLQLKESLKKAMPHIAKSSFDENFSLFYDKTIAFEKCTNCGDCISFCPTNALLHNANKQGINFNAGSCIGCGICEDICKVDAITTPSQIDFVEVVHDRGKNLVYYEMVMCHECRCPYPYRGGDPICDRCRDFKQEFEHIFTLARDI